MTISELRGRATRWLRRIISRPTYERVAPFLVLFCLVCVPVFTVATFALSQQQNQESQDRDAAFRDEGMKRDAAIDAVLGCLDDYISSLSSALPAVREASIARDEATKRRDHAQRRFSVAIRQVLVGRVTGPEALALLVDTNDRYIVTSRQLDRKQAEFEVARAENPYPRISGFCGEGD